MYYDITNNKELTHISFAKKARPGVSFPRYPTEEQLLDLDIATVIVPQEVDKTEYNTLVNKYVEVSGDVYTLKYTYEYIGLSSAKTKKIKEINDYGISLINLANGNPEMGVNMDAETNINTTILRRNNRIDKLVGELNFTEEEKREAKTDQKLSDFSLKIQGDIDKAVTNMLKSDTTAEIEAFDIQAQNWSTWTPPNFT